MNDISHNWIPYEEDGNISRKANAMTVKIIANKSNHPGKLADAEIHFTDGPLVGLKMIGFEIWQAGGKGLNVMFPARSYSVNGEKRRFSILRPISFESGRTNDKNHERVRDLILEAYAEYERTAEVYDRR